MALVLTATVGGERVSMSIVDLQTFVMASPDAAVCVEGDDGQTFVHKRELEDLEVDWENSGK